MIRLKNLNKYFNKGKVNQNHVARDINLEFADNGLVVLLGTSGSGKTTLLNVLSGMDKFDSGILEFNGEVFTKYKSSTWDKLRKEKIGYIYQNYHLLKNITVYENIEMSLKMFGVKDDEEIAKRVNYLLKAVGLENYGDRLSKQLSGGQQQRVAFARALSKNPEIILADEPTGNVDSKTTIELMHILKSISKTKLVIMVTHEQALAHYYADRIIEIENGAIIKDFLNDQTQDLLLSQEQIIYLKDYEEKVIKNDNVKLTHYVEEVLEKPDKLDIDLIERNDTLYVRIDAKKARNIIYIDKDSEIELLDESRKDFNLKEQKKFVLDPIKREGDKKIKSTITIKDSLMYALRKIDVLNYGGKMLYLVLALVGVITSLSVGLLGEAFNFEETYAQASRNYILLETGNASYEDLIALEDLEGVEHVMFITKEEKFRIESNKYYEVSNGITFEAVPVILELLDESTLIKGRVPDEGEFGIVIDKSIADELIRKNSERGIETYDDILNCNFKIQTSGSDYNYEGTSKLLFPITGIAEDNSKTIWMEEQLIYTIVTTNLIDYEILGDGFVINEGVLPEYSSYIMINSHSQFLADGDVPSKIGIATGEYEISGIYDYIVDGVEYNLSNAVVTTDELIKQEYYISKYRYGSTLDVFVYSNDVENTMLTLNGLGYDATNIYLELDEINMEIKLQDRANILFLSITAIVVSSLSIFFIMRSSLLSRVYEVSVYRSLGASKWEIRKMFFVEIMLVTTLSTILGYILMCLILAQAEAASGGYVNLFKFTFLSVGIGLVGLYVVNIVFGLIPINFLLRKTPSDIMKKHDL
ncbi:ABC transporter ATP-binding protein YtrE [Candidatus Izimaplasma bacterium HR1]|jgi:ABC-type lipoprotein export system ATPase subunit/ABC-type antimicrobial peptide transport system permease subunit|uniref:ABC transporter ATP-binding protein/permease n=1 Tax=Candidatus Izimoplasma sp. HR1 TaxID=1541959 RepID=UPI0004F7CD86|nr:ABC transporter ATP-binding protein YtrE [Candidatus Izimaplasma bacterium HR1]